MALKKATREQTKARLAIAGPPGAGKTYSALQIGSFLGKRVAVLCTERKSARKYAQKSTGGEGFVFDVEDELTDFNPENYIAFIKAVEKGDYDVTIIDSFSHAWAGVGGALEKVDRAAQRDRNNNKFAAWREVTPLHNRMVDAILTSKCHVIVTMRSHMEYVQEKDERGKTVIRKVGLKPIQREGVEYEFDVVADMDLEHNFVVSKTRCSALDGQIIHKPGQDVAEILLEWLSDGDTPAQRPAPPPKAEKPAGRQAKKTGGEKPETPEQPHEPDKPEPAPAMTPATTIAGLFENLPMLLRAFKPDISEENIQFAKNTALIAFDANQPSDIPEDQLESLRRFMKKNLLAELREAGILPPPRERSNAA